MKREYVADPSTLCGAERFTFTEGKAKGVDAVRLYNGKLDLTVVLDRCMDIFRLFYKGMPVSYVSKNSLVSPRLAETGAYGFLNSFGAGFMYTCGLDNIGVLGLEPVTTPMPEKRPRIIKPGESARYSVTWKFSD